MAAKTTVLVTTSTFPRWKHDTDQGFVLDLCRYLKNENFNVHVLAPVFPGAKAEEEMDGIKVFRYRYFIGNLQRLSNESGILVSLRNNPFNYLLVVPFLLFQLLTLRKLLISGEYDCVHAHWLIPQGLIAILARMISGRHPVKILCTAHGSDVLSLRGVIFDRLKKWVINHSDHTTVVSWQLFDTCIRLGVDDDRISVQAMGVDSTNRFFPEACDRIYDVLYVGRLQQSKGVSCLLQAVHRLKVQYPGIQLLIVGAGPELAALHRERDQLGLGDHVDFRGPVNQTQLADIYRTARVFVLPSLQEGLGLVLVEAQACGCAVVASDLDSIRDVIEDKRNGLLFEPGNPEDLAGKIAELLASDELYASLTAAGRESAVQRFDWKTIARTYSSLIGQLSG
ncbi:MAG: glycosyltransferase [Thiotrichales bacterium]|nr:glycosyltransferase [Thiotrichales bacterium]